MQKSQFWIHEQQVDFISSIQLTYNKNTTFVINIVPESFLEIEYTVHPQHHVRL